MTKHEFSRLKKGDKLIFIKRPEWFSNDKTWYGFKGETRVREIDTSYNPIRTWIEGYIGYWTPAQIQENFDVGPNL